MGGRGWKTITSGHDQAELQGPIQIYKMDDYFFLPDPEAFIYDHFPKQPAQWQLLARPVKYQEFINMVCLKDGFFRYGLKDVSQRKAVINTKNGEVIIDFTMPESSFLVFSHNMFVSERITNYVAVSSTLSTSSLKRFVVIDTKGNIKRVSVKFQEVGKYKLVIKAGTYTKQVPTRKIKVNIR